MSIGKKTGGRRPGSRNKATIEREMAAQAQVIITKRVSKTDLEIMLEIRDFWMGYAATEQRAATEQNRLPNIDKMAKALDLAGTMAAKRAPFLHGRLASITLKDEHLDLSRLTDEQLAQLEQLRQIAAVPSGDTSRTPQTFN
jgi:hypothetical protein